MRTKYILGLVVVLLTVFIISNKAHAQINSDPACYNFTVNLSIGSSGADVTVLQKFLVSRGFNTEVNGYFASSTYIAVMNYQSSVGIPATGSVGPITIAKIKSECRTPVDIRVLKPNGGGVIFGTTTPNNLIVTWTSTPPYQPVDISLINAGSMNEMPGFVFRNVVSTTSTQMFGITIPPYSIPDSSYIVRVCATGTNNCDSSDGSFQFSSVYASVNIISPNGGETLVKGQTYNIQWRSIGLQTVNINLLNATSSSYNIATNVIASSSIYRWTVPNTIRDGTTYTIAIGKNNIGGVSAGTFSILSTSTQTRPTITIVNPNGGGYYRNDGSLMPLRWYTTNVPANQRLDVVRLRSYPVGQEYNLVSSVINDGQEDIAIPRSIPSGLYTLEIKSYVNNLLVTDASDSYFNIYTSTTSTSTMKLVPSDESSVSSSINTNSPLRLLGCNPSQSTASVGAVVNWTAVATGGVAPYKYYWSDVSGAIESNANGVAKRSYSTVGDKYMSIAVIDSRDNKTSWAFCSGKVNVVAPATNGVIDSKSMQLHNLYYNWQPSSETSAVIKAMYKILGL